MTHTYVKFEEDRYGVGQWLINREGFHSFVPIFYVPSLKQAFAAVNMLNGGTRVATDALHIREKE
jgi:hypothetical protein